MLQRYDFVFKYQSIIEKNRNHFRIPVSLYFILLHQYFTISFDIDASSGLAGDAAALQVVDV